MRGQSMGLFCVAIAFSLTCSALQADDVGTQAKAVVAKRQEAVVTVQLVLSVKGGEAMDGGDVPAEALGTVLDPSGLVVVAYSAIDPTEAMNDYMGQMPGDSEVGRMSTEVKEVKFRLQDGQEIPGEVALRDKDLDIAFLRPSSPLAKAMVAVDMKDIAVPEIMDHLVFINRLGKVGNWAPGVTLERVQGRIDKPRTMIVPTDIPEIGSPAFNLQGQFVGITLVKVAEGDSGINLSPVSSPSSMGILPVLLPADQIIDVAKQAMEAKPEQPKAANP